MHIGMIKWPDDHWLAVKLYLRYLLRVVRECEIEFPSVAPAPLPIVLRYVAEVMGETEYRATANLWWRYLDETNSVRDFDSQESLAARIAISLLSVTKDQAPQLPEHLSWFLEVIEKMGIDLDGPIEVMAEHFEV